MNEKQDVNPVWNEKELAPTTQEQDHTPTEVKTSKKLPELPSIVPPCLHEIEGNPEPTHHEQATEGEPPSFTHKIGKTTYHVNMHFSETATESLLDKIKRMLINDFNNL